MESSGAWGKFRLRRQKTRRSSASCEARAKRPGETRERTLAAFRLHKSDMMYPPVRGRFQSIQFESKCLLSVSSQIWAATLSFPRGSLFAQLFAWRAVLEPDADKEYLPGVGTRRRRFYHLSTVKLPSCPF